MDTPNRNSRPPDTHKNHPNTPNHTSAYYNPEESRDSAKAKEPESERCKHDPQDNHPYNPHPKDNPDTSHPQDTPNHTNHPENKNMKCPMGRPNHTLG